VEVSVRHNPGFGIARIGLAPGEKVKVEAGAMAAHSAGMTLQSEMQGGLFKSLKRAALGGDSLFVTTYTAPAGGGWLDVAATLPGDMHTIQLLPDRPVILTRGAWIASSESVELDTRWGGMKQLVGGEGGFMVHATGSGTVVVASYGALDVVTLGPGESFTLDSGHLVAFDQGVQATLRKAASGVMQSLKSGEGFVFDFVGPGDVLVQTHNQRQLIGWLTEVLPFSRGGEG
jgi:uncharacterized protein (TIGR00266 family)